MTAKQKISDLHAKYYGGGKKKADPVAKVVKTKAVDQVNTKLAKAGLSIQFVKAKGLKVKDAGPVINRKETDREVALRIAPDLKKNAEEIDKGAKLIAAESRSTLMAQAKAAGIKYFRVMNKEELDRVLNLHVDGNHTEIAKIQAGANARWKSGWGKRSKVQK